MSDEFDVKVGNFGMTFDTSTRSGEFTNYAIEQSSAVSLQDVLDLGISVERGLWSLVERLFNDQGLAMFSRTKAETPGFSSDEYVQQMLETVSSGEACDDGSSSSRWILTFLQENKDRPDLISRVLCELKARECSVRDFFRAYVYSNTDNIGANLHFLDYLRACENEPEERLDPNRDLSRTATALLTDMRHQLSITEAPSDHQALWQALEEGVSRWSDKDILALQRLSQKFTSARHFAALAGLAQSLNPLAMYHFLHYLTLSGAKEWNHVLTADRELSAESLHAHYVIVDVAIAGLASGFQDVPTSYDALLSLSDVEHAVKNLGLPPNSTLPNFIIRSIDYSHFPTDGAERLAKALSLIVEPGDIERQAESFRSSQ